ELPFLRQGEDVKGVCSAWRSDIVFDRAHCSRYQAGCREIDPCNDGNMLPAVDSVRNRARGNRGAENRFPHDLSIVGIEGSKAAIEIAKENDVSSGRKCGTVGRNLAQCPPLYLARGHVDLGKAVQ